MSAPRKPFEASIDRNELAAEGAPSLIDVHSDSVGLIVNSWLTRKEKITMAETCQTYNNLFQPDLDKEAKPLVEAALHYAAFGKKDELNELLKKHRGLIYKRSQTLDIRGRIVHGSVYRIALGAKDWSPYPEKFEEMVEMIESHMRKFPDGENEITLQKAEQFPKGWEEEERKREEQDSAELKKVFAAIDQSVKDEDCAEAIEQFRAYLKSQNEIKTGYHFNDKLLTEAHALYKGHFEKFGGNYSRKNKLASDKVLGSIQDRLTACIAMAHCDDLMRIADGDRALSRKLDVEGSPFFSPGLGVDHFVYSYYTTGVGWAVGGCGVVGGGGVAWTTYVERKDETSPISNIPTLSSRNRSKPHRA